jgi:hypothetical protein
MHKEKLGLYLVEKHVAASERYWLQNPRRGVRVGLARAWDSIGIAYGWRRTMSVVHLPSPAEPKIFA